MAERVRRIKGGFTFIPHRFLHDGFFASLSRDELLLYFFLTLASDRNGISFYGYDAICALLDTTNDAYIMARDGLLDKDLLAFDGRRFQVLSLPRRPRQSPVKALGSQEDFETHDPATIRALLRRRFDKSHPKGGQR